MSNTTPTQNYNSQIDNYDKPIQVQGVKNIDESNIFKIYGKDTQDIADSSKNFFTDFSKGSYPDSRSVGNINNILYNSNDLKEISSNFLDNQLFINCVDNMLQLKNIDDQKYINFFKTNDISNYQDTHFDYLSNKISKFLSLGPEDYENCFSKIQTSDDFICNGGIISASIFFISNIFSFFSQKITIKDIPTDNINYVKLKRLYDIFLNNISAIMKKTIDISKYFEKKICKKVSTLTTLCDNTYQKLFPIKASVEYKLFDKTNLNISLLNKLNNSFIGQVVILICIVFILWKILNIFN
tara:strand:+ start:766 stop:1659 length:894 start_codon:yes stop_codon:yes gene_type:complete